MYDSVGVLVGHIFDKVFAITDELLDKAEK